LPLILAFRLILSEKPYIEPLTPAVNAKKTGREGNEEREALPGPFAQAVSFRNRSLKPPRNQTAGHEVMRGLR
jgi:hypothetical protein